MALHLLVIAPALYMLHLSLNHFWVAQSLIGRSLNGLFAVEEQGRLLQSVPSCLDEKEPSEYYQENLDASVHKVISPRYASAIGGMTSSPIAFKAMGLTY